MSVWRIYRYEDMILAPTMVVTDDGVFIETQPVQAVSIESPEDMLALINRLLDNPPGRAQEKDLNNPDNPESQELPAILERLSIKRWKDFEKRALLYTLHRTGWQLTMHVTGRGPDGMWTVAESRCRSFSLAEFDSFAVVSRSIMQELVSRRPVESPQLLGKSTK
jgi:hypothetical protein